MRRLFLFASIVFINGAAIADDKKTFPISPTPQIDANQGQRAITQKLSAQYAANSVYASSKFSELSKNQLKKIDAQALKIANQAKQNQKLIADKKAANSALEKEQSKNKKAQAKIIENNKAIEKLAAETKNLEGELEKTYSELDLKAKEILKLENDLYQQAMAFEAAIKDAAVQNNPKILALLARIGEGDIKALDELFEYNEFQDKIDQKTAVLKSAARWRATAYSAQSQLHSGKLPIEKVIEAFEEAVFRDSKNSALLVDLGELYISANSFEKSSDICGRGKSVARSDKEKMYAAKCLADSFYTLDIIASLKFRLEEIDYLKRLSPIEYFYQDSLFFAYLDLHKTIELVGMPKAIDALTEIDISQFRGSDLNGSVNEYFMEVGISYIRSGDLERYDGQIEGVKKYEQGIAILDNIHFENDSAEFNRKTTIAIALRSMGELYKETDAKMSLEWLRASVDIYESQISNYLLNKENKWQYALSLISLGGALLPTDRPAALKYFDKSIEVNVTKNPGLQDRTENQQSIQHIAYLIGLASKGISNSDALQYLELSKRTLIEMITSDPQSERAKYQLASVYAAIGDIQLTENPKEAEKSFKEKLLIIEKMLHNDSNNRLLGEDYMNSLVMMGYATQDIYYFRLAASQALKLIELGYYNPEEDNRYKSILFEIKRLEKNGK